MFVPIISIMFTIGKSLNAIKSVIGVYIKSIINEDKILEVRKDFAL